MTEVQYIEKDGRRAFAVVPIEIWERLQTAAEDIDDVAAFDAAMAGDDGERIPLEIVEAKHAGVHPVRAWREHRQVTVEALAAQAGISKPYLSQIENRKRRGTAETLSAIARALDIGLDALVE